MDNKELESILPSVHTMLGALNNKDFNDYEKTLDDATKKSIGELKRIIDDGTLALDPEQLVSAVKVLTNAKKDILESKRKLYDTCIRGEVMIKALEQNDNKGKGKDSSVLLDYLEKNNLNTNLDKIGTAPSTSIFETIANDEEK